MNVCIVYHVQLLLLASSLVWRLILAGRRSEHLFMDVELIRLVDPFKHGFHVIIGDQAYEYLIANPFQLPTIYVTAIALDGSHAVRQVIFKDSVDNKMIKLHGLKERSWYYLCLEYETVSVGNHNNETTSTHCKMFQTLDRFGKANQSTISEVQLHQATQRSLKFKVGINATFPLRLLVYLSDGSVPTKTYLVESPKFISIHFSELQPNTAYGSLCIIEEPLLQSYTMLGRAIQVQHKNCYPPNSVMTKAIEEDIENGFSSRSQRNSWPETVALNKSPKPYCYSNQLLRMSANILVLWLSRASIWNVLNLIEWLRI